MKINFLTAFSTSWLRTFLDYTFPSTGGKGGGSKGLSNKLVVAMAVYGVMLMTIGF